MSDNLKVGDYVQRKPGSSYLFPSVIIGLNPKLDGKTIHAECEGFLPGMEGMTHVFPVSGLAPMEYRWLQGPRRTSMSEKQLLPKNTPIMRRQGDDRSRTGAGGCGGVVAAKGRFLRTQGEAATERLFRTGI